MFSQIMHDTAYGINAKCQITSSLHRQIAFLFRQSFTRSVDDAARERETGEVEKMLGLATAPNDAPKHAGQERLAEAFAASMVLCLILAKTIDPETGKAHDWLKNRSKRGDSQRQAFYLFEDLINEQADFFTSRKLGQIKANAALLKQDPAAGIAAAKADATNFLATLTKPLEKMVLVNMKKYATEGEGECIDTIEEVIVEAGLDPDTVCRESCQGVIKWQAEQYNKRSVRVDVGVWAIANGLSPVAAAAKAAELNPPPVDPVPATS